MFYAHTLRQCWAGAFGTPDCTPCDYNGGRSVETNGTLYAAPPMGTRCGQCRGSFTLPEGRSSPYDSLVT